MIAIRKTHCTGRTQANDGLQLAGKMVAAGLSRNLPRLSSHTFAHIFLGFTTLMVYWNSLKGDFVHDDLPAIVNNEDVAKGTSFTKLFTNDFWGQPLSDQISHKSYRPLTTLTFRLNAVIHGMNSIGFHIVNVVLHVLVVIILYQICGHILKWTSNKSTLAAMLFAVHPVHAEAVSNIVGRADILATLFFLLSFLSFTRVQESRSKVYWQLMAIVMATMSFLSKEQGIMSFAFLIIYDILCSTSQKFKRKNGITHPRNIYNSIKICFSARNAVILITALALMTMRMVLMGFQLPQFSREDNPASHSKFLKTRFLTYSHLAVINSWLLLFPKTLAYDWQLSSIQLIDSFLDPRNMATIFLVIITIAFVLKILTPSKVEDKRTMCLGFILPILAFLPASNIFFYVGFVIAERILYMPSLGFCILVSHGAFILYEKLTTSSYCSTQVNFLRLSLKITIALLILTNIAKTSSRNKVWASRKSLFLSGVRDLPQNAKMHYNYGNFLKDNEDSVGAERHYKRAVELWPYYASAHNNLATVINDTGKAVHHLRQAIKFNPRHGRAFYNLAMLHSKKNLTNSAISLLETAIARDRSLVEAHSKLASIYFSIGKFHEAELIHKKIISMRVNDADLVNNYAVFLEKTGRKSEARKYYQKAIELQPDNIHAVKNKCRLLESDSKLMEAKRLYEKFNEEHEYVPEIMEELGGLLIKMNLLDDAAVLYEKLLSKVPKYNRAKVHYAQILIEQRHFVKAEDLLLSVVKDMSTDQLALFHLSNLYRKMNRTTEAIEHILSAIDACDDSSNICSGLYVLHGDIMKHLKYFKEAAESYKMALDLRPGLYHAHMNLGAIYHLQSEYNEAWRHYLAAKVLQPTHPILLENMAKLERAQTSSLSCTKDSQIHTCW